jgi:hypothetical protein
MKEQLQLNALKNEYRAYYKNYLLLLSIGLLWILSAFVGTFDIQISIFILFLGVTLFKPILFGLGTLLRAPKIYKDESLTLLTRLILIGTIFGVIAGFFPFTENINLFFPTFTIIFGLIFAAIAYCTGLRMYWLLSAALIVGGSYIGHNFPEEFITAGYFAGFTMTGFGVINGIFGKKARVSFRFLSKKLKTNLKVNLKSLKIKKPIILRKKAKESTIA